MKLLWYLYSQAHEDTYTYMLGGLIWGNRETSKSMGERRTSKKVHLTKTKRTFVCNVVQKSLCVLFFFILFVSLSLSRSKYGAFDCISALAAYRWVKRELKTEEVNSLHEIVQFYALMAIDQH